MASVAKLVFFITVTSMPGSRGGSMREEGMNRVAALTIWTFVRIFQFTPLKYCIPRTTTVAGFPLGYLTTAISFQIVDFKIFIHR